MTDEVTRELVELADAVGASLAPADWSRLRDITERVAAHGGPFARWVPPKRIGDNSFKLGYAFSGELMREAVQTIYNLGLIVPFAWPEWEEGRRLVAGETFDPDTLTWAQTVGLLTALIRQDRFSEGRWRRRSRTAPFHGYWYDSWTSRRQEVRPRPPSNQAGVHVGRVGSSRSAQLGGETIRTDRGGRATVKPCRRAATANDSGLGSTGQLASPASPTVSRIAVASSRAR